MNHINLSGIGATYRRVSDEEQDAERQAVEIAGFLKREGATVDPKMMFQDLGFKRHQAANRPAFQRLLRAVDDGKVKWIVIDRQDRFEAGDKFEFISIMHKLRQSGCRLYTVDGREVTAKDIGSFLQTALASEQSEAELREKAVRIVTAKLVRAKRGEWQGGHVPYGMDVVCFAVPEMTELWRVRINGRDVRVKLSADGSRKEYNGKSNFPATEAGQILQLRPSTDAKRIEIVNRVFRTYATQAISLSSIAKELNREGVKPSYGEAWESNIVYMMLKNPVYMGVASWNKHSQARYIEITDGKRREVSSRINLRREKSQWTLSDELFPPVVDPKLWETVQTKIDARDKNRRHNAPGNTDLWLSRLLYCGHCGKPMRAFPRPKSGKHEYCCTTYSKSIERGTATCCKRNSVRHETVERYLTEHLEKAGTILADASPSMSFRGCPPRLKQSLTEASAAWAKVTHRLREAGDLQLAYDDYTPEGDILAAYSALFDRDLPTLQGRRTELHAEHDKLTERILNLPSSAKLAIGKASATLTALEEKITDIEGRESNAAESYVQAIREHVLLTEDWTRAFAATAGQSSARERAEAVSKVIGKVVLKFRETGRRAPSTELDTMDIYAVGDDPCSNVPVQTSF